MNAKLFKSNCLLTVNSKDNVLYYMVGNIIIPNSTARPRNILFINMPIYDIYSISRYIKDYYNLRLTYKRIASIIIERSI